MKLDVVVPTYNRSKLLRKTLNSLLRASVPVSLEVAILVIDNNSSDDTEAVVCEIQQTAMIPVHYIRERQQGLSHARNRGIASGDGDIIGFIDDDEEVNHDWYEVTAREFTNPEIQFIGGPCLANCEMPMPHWLPHGYNGAIGVINPKPRSLFNLAFPGNLNGGNAVIRRKVFEQIGTYSLKLGRSGKGLLSEEDAEFYRRLLAANLTGYHIPDLIIHHYIPQERLTKKYHRRWAYWRAVSQGVADRDLPQPVAYMAGIPRYLFGRAIKGLALYPVHRLANNGASKAFAGELATWDLVGFLYGKHFIRIDSYYAEKK